MTHKKRHIKKEDFQRYLENQMTEAERNTFERELQKHPFEAEALEGMQQISPIELKNDLKELKTKLKPVKRKINYRFWAAAATFLLLISAGVMWFQLKDRSPVPEVAQSKSIQQQEEKVDSKMQAAEESLPETSAKENTEIRETAQPEQILLNTEKIKSPESESQINVSSDKKMLKAEKGGLGEQNPQIPDDEVIAGKAISLGDSTPLQGAAIVERGVKNRNESDLKGNSQLKVSATSDSSFVASYAGMENTEFYSDSDSAIVVGVEPKQVAMEEAVSARNVKGKSATGRNVSSVTKVKPDAEAQPRTGMDKFQKYIEENAILPEDYDDKRVVVKVKLKINSEGEITEIQNTNNVDSTLFKRAKDLIKQGPEWVPEFKNGENIESETDLKIVFKK